jgi:hypothetical protein
MFEKILHLSLCQISPIRGTHITDKAKSRNVLQMSAQSANFCNVRFIIPVMQSFKMTFYESLFSPSRAPQHWLLSGV